MRRKGNRRREREEDKGKGRGDGKEKRRREMLALYSKEARPHIRPY
jgi:hypothetical protein